MAKNKISLFKPAHSDNWHVRFRWEGRDFKPSSGTTIRAEAERIAEEVRIRAIVSYEARKNSPSGSSHPKEEALHLDEVERLFAEYAKLPKSPDSAPKYIESFRKLRILHDLNTYPQLQRFLETHDIRSENKARRVLRKKTGELRPKDLQDGGYKALMRNASGVFSRAALKYYYRETGSKLENPFSIVDCRAQFEPFRSPPGALEFVEKLQNDAKDELVDQPEVYILFLLCLGCGLRAQEATHLRWQDVGEDYVFVRSDEVHKTKSRRGRYVPISPKLRDLINSHRIESSRDGDFVMRKVRKRRSRGLTSVRCCHRQIQLSRWLKTKGIQKPLTSHPVHYLRKLFGAIIVTKHENGYALAKEYLGHDSIQTTEKIYAGLLNRPTPDIF